MRKTLPRFAWEYRETEPKMNLKRHLTLAAILCLTPTLATAEELIVACSNDKDWCELMASKFSQKTKIEVTLLRMSSGETLSLLRQQADDPRVDVWWGGTGDPHLVAAAEDLTQAAESDTQGQHHWASTLATISAGKAQGIHAGALGIAYNPGLLSEKGLKPPLCWEALADLSYRGEIQMADPNTSGTAYTEVATLVQIFGERAAFKLLTAIGENVQQYTRSGSAPSKAAARGEAAIAVGFMHDMVKLRKKGLPLTIVSPCEGTGYEVGGVSVVKGAKNLGSAQKWVKYTLSAEAQSLGLQAGVYNVPSNAAAEQDPDSPNLMSIKLIDYDFAHYGSSEVRQHLLKRWNLQIKK